MSEGKDFVASIGSDSRKTPVRVAFVTRRTSPHVTTHDDDTVMAFPEAIFRAMVAIEVLALVLVALSLVWNAPGNSSRARACRFSRDLVDIDVKR